MFKRLITITAVAIVATMAVAGAALALGVSGTITGTAGIAIDPGSAPSFTDTLSGSDQTVSYQPNLTVTDARGTGAGWHLTVAATALSDGTHSLSQSITGVNESCVSGSTCTLPTNSVSLPVSMASSGSSFYSSASGYGLGKVAVNPTVSVAIPGNSYAGSYSSTVTFATVAGP
jgi:WxL domain surface cell wall-binding